uniref:G_PROTEIN_RECEP_F2_4 domain-containing protein n=1 Tax=Heterorhabditis bacteriophora TaxID=37862 RepID=A0A1I7WLA1_HETBA
MVAACAGCDNSEPWTAIITGSGAAIAYLFFSNLIIKKQLFWQMICASAIILWSSLFMIPIFLALKKVCNRSDYFCMYFNFIIYLFPAINNVNVKIIVSLDLRDFTAKPVEDDTTRRRYYSPSMYAHPENIQKLKINTEIV